MKLIAIETATEACSVALWVDGEVAERFELAPRRHASLVLPWIDALMAEAGLARSALDAIACGHGPGAFTGVRLAVAMTQGIALGLDRPAIGISTLAALADAVPGETAIAAAIDARMSEVYLGCFRRDHGVLREVAKERVLDPGSADRPGQPVHGVGTGFDACDGALRRRFAEDLIDVDAQALPRARHVAALAAVRLDTGERPDAALLQPAYLRERVALKLVEQEAIGRRRKD